MSGKRRPPADDTVAVVPAIEELKLLLRKPPVVKVQAYPRKFVRKCEPCDRRRAPNA